MEYGRSVSFVLVSYVFVLKSVRYRELLCSCCHIISSAVSFTACLTCVVLAFAEEQLHRYGFSVFVPISC